MLLSGNIPQKSELLNFVLKFLFVIYFSVGININTASGDDLYRMDGMIQWIFPFLLGGMDQLASWIIDASPSTLCDFSKVYYPDSLEHLRMWDALDCRLSHYLGLDMVQTMLVENASREHDFSKLDFLSYPIPPYVYLLIPAIISGIPSLISLALMYPLLIISIGAFVLNATVVCIISIVILAVLAPLFVPLFLFNYTRGYFDAWVKLLMSFMLQPIVVVVFMTTLLSVYDLGFYGTCKYAYKDFAHSSSEFDMNSQVDLESKTNNESGTRGTRYFYINQDWTQYTKDEKQKCQDSLGFMLNNPYQVVYDISKKTIDKGEHDAIVSTPGMFFNMATVVFEKIKTLINAMLIACFILYLMYHFSEQLAEFAADMTEGVSVGNMAIKPQAIFKAGMKLASAAGGAQGQGTKSMSQDKISAQGRKSAKDMFSTGKPSSSSGDSISTAKDDTTSKDKIKAVESSRGKALKDTNSSDSKTPLAIESSSDSSSDSNKNNDSSDTSSSKEQNDEDKDTKEY